MEKSVCPLLAEEKKDWKKTSRTLCFGGHWSFICTTFGLQCSLSLGFVSLGPETKKSFMAVGEPGALRDWEA